MDSRQVKSDRHSDCERAGVTELAFIIYIFKITFQVCFQTVPSNGHITSMHKVS